MRLVLTKAMVSILLVLTLACIHLLNYLLLRTLKIYLLETDTNPSESKQKK